jgi:hypothetical protein
MECHTPMGPRGREFESSYGKGGFEFAGPWGKSVSRNITSHKEKGIGAWSDAEIKRAITEGVSRDGSRLKPPMGYAFYKNMTETDLDAIVAYLRTCRQRSDGSPLPLLLADRVVEVHRREIVGEQFSGLGRAGLLGPSLEQHGKRKAEAELLLQGTGPLGECGGIRGGIRGHHRDHLALARWVQVHLGENARKVSSVEA